MEEVWEPIKGYQGFYEISNLGKVRSVFRYDGRAYKHGKILTPWLSKPGRYAMITLWKNNKKKHLTLHRLVWDHFGNKSRNGQLLQVDHIDENKTNCSINNLQLLTTRQNVSKSIRHKKIAKSPFIGIYWKRDKQRWIARLRLGKKIIYLGSSKIESEAALFYQKKLLQLKIAGLA